MEKSISTGEASRLLGVSQQSIRNFIRDGKLKATKTQLGNLVDQADVERLREERSGGAVSPHFGELPEAVS